MNKMRVRSCVLACLASLAGSAWSVADVTPSGAMLRFPDISATHIAFVYANDIWTAPRTGGTATRLASPPGAEAFPRFSPDGKAIAFAGNYEGNRDLYTIPVEGGVPTRVTYHPAAEMLCDWSPDGSRLVFLTNGLAGLPRQTQMFTVGARGGLPEKMPMPYSGFGSISRDGEWVAFTPHSTDTRTWKRYRGGMATDLWLLNLKTNASKKITDWEGTDTLPMWGYGPASGIVFYLSDAGPEHRLNIWSYDTASGVRTQVTAFTEDDVRWPAVGPGPGGNEAAWGEVVFQLGSQLRVLDLATKQTREVKVTIPGDRPKIMPRDEDAATNMQGLALSPTGKRVLAVGRGDIWSLPAKEGVVRNLTRSDGVFERDPSWSPDGKWIAYWSDQDGEYDLWLRAADAKGPEEKGEKKDDKAAEPKEGEEKKADGEAPKEAEAKGAEPGTMKPTRLTDLGPGFRYRAWWSPDSTKIVFTDRAGRLTLVTLSFEGGTPKATLKEIDKDPWNEGASLSWSSDSNWLAYTRGDDAQPMSSAWIYNVKEGTRTRVTDPITSVSGVAFDRKGDYLYMVANRNWSPKYEDLGTTFIYSGTEVLLMAPLREDMKNPFSPKSDEEEYKKDDKAKNADKAKDAPKDDAKPAEKKPDAAKPDDGVTGTWDVKAMPTGGAEGAPPPPPGGIPFTMKLRLGDGGKVTGTLTGPMGASDVSGTYDAATKTVTLTITVNGQPASITVTVNGDECTGTFDHARMGGTLSGKRTSKEPPGDEGGKRDGAKEGGKDKADDKKSKDLKIDLDGLERRAILLPVQPGNFGNLESTDDGKLVYTRTTSRGVPGEAGIKIFDPRADEKEEKAVTAGGGFEISADGKKLLVYRGGAGTIVDASAGGGKTQAVSTSGMRVRIRPREEWRQIFSDVYRLQRDFFYEPTLHNVDWAKMKAHYGAMIDDASSREDVAWIIAEFISELNIGHAYVTGPGDVESGPASVSVGMLGCDFALENGAYRITAIHEGGPWDSDARGPLSQPGEKKNRVSVGDYLLAVNGTPVDTSLDPWAAFVGLADRPTLVTVSSEPTMSGKAREVLVKPVGNETNLRYRAWIEKKRAYVAEKSGGKIGYIYVPNTGQDGQNDLVRQFYGQRDKAALLIDERWNGGGQIPTRFIELLNRPVTNYWARRDFNDWTWPPDSHQGPKAMLINGLAGSGGDMFPWLFRFNNLGKLIGTRTWGGLVGISGNPGLIDGGGISVPTFGFYKKDGTWGVEGHGTDPDIEVIDDPGLMTSKEPVGGGADPQLDAAIAHLMGEIAKNPYLPPKRPASPDRKGMGIPERDR